MSDTVNLDGGSKPLDYIPGTKKSAPHHSSLQPTSRPLLRRIFDRPDTGSNRQRRPSYSRPILGQGPSHSIKSISRSKSKSKTKSKVTSKPKFYINSSEDLSPDESTPKPKLKAHFANPRPTVQTQATDAMGAATEMRRKMMMEMAKEEDRRRSGVAPPQSQHHSPVVSPFVPAVTPRVPRVDTSGRDRTAVDTAGVGARRDSSDSDSIDRIRRPSQERERRRSSGDRERSKHHRPSINVAREPHAYDHAHPELFADVSDPVPIAMPAEAAQVQQQHHHQTTEHFQLPSKVLHLVPHHHIVPQQHAVVNRPTTGTVQPTKNPRSRSKSAYCLTSFLQAIRDLFLTLGHLCGTIASAILTFLLGLVHVILTSLLLVIAFFVDTFTTFLRIFFNVITCHFASGNYRWETVALSRAWQWGRESQWVWGFINHVTGSYEHDPTDRHHAGAGEGNQAGHDGRVPSAQVDLEKGLHQGPAMLAAQSAPGHMAPHTEDSIIPPSNMTPGTRRKAALAFIRPRSSRTPSTLDPLPLARKEEGRWSDRLLGMMGLEIVWEEMEMRDRDRGRVVVV